MLPCQGCAMFLCFQKIQQNPSCWPMWSKNLSLFLQKCTWVCGPVPPFIHLLPGLHATMELQTVLQDSHRTHCLVRTSCPHPTHPPTVSSIWSSTSSSTSNTHTHTQHSQQEAALICYPSIGHCHLHWPESNLLHRFPALSQQCTSPPSVHKWKKKGKKRRKRKPCACMGRGVGVEIRLLLTSSTVPTNPIFENQWLSFPSPCLGVIMPHDSS